MKKLLLITICLLGFGISNAQQMSDTMYIPHSLTGNIDSLLNDYRARTALSTPKNCEQKDVNPFFPDSVYITRLRQLPDIIEMPYNDVVRKFIDLYTTKYRKKFSYILGISNFYMPIFEEALDVYDLPQELKYLPIIESALNPNAESPTGGVGLWQLPLETVKAYDLEMNSLVDERRDPIKSTWAAVHYLKDLYSIYRDWNLVIAAYNCGPDNINKAIHRADGTRDYWKIYNRLPNDTRGYVPAFIAANYIMNYYCNHNICPMVADLGQNTDTIQINHRLHFQQIAGICKTNIDEIRALNPQYKMDIVPGGKLYTLRLPIDIVSKFIDNEDAIYKYRTNELFTNRETVALDQSLKSAATPASITSSSNSNDDSEDAATHRHYRNHRKHHSASSGRKTRSSRKSRSSKKSKHSKHSKQTKKHSRKHSRRRR